MEILLGLRLRTAVTLVVRGFVVTFHNGMNRRASITIHKQLVVVYIGIGRVNFAIIYNGPNTLLLKHLSTSDGIISYTIGFLQLHNTLTKDRLR